MKQRFSSLDVKVIAHELNQSLVSLRIANIYDLSSRIFLFKCAKPGSKAQLLVDSGFRCHLTSFTRTAASAPSTFVSRLRKYLKSRRITSVKQVGTDRVIEISFSDGQFKLFLEFFAAGNIVLTDAELNVLALLRQVNEGDEDVDVKLGGKYVLEAKQNYNGLSEINKDTIKAALEKQIAKVKSAQEVGGKKAKRHKGGDDLRKALSIGFPEYPPVLLEHVFVQSGFGSEAKLEDVAADDALLAKVQSALESARQTFNSLDSATSSKGYIVAKLKPKSTGDSNENGSTPAEPGLLYDDFHPFEPAQFKDNDQLRLLEHEGFNKTVDEFFSSLESQRLELRLTEREEAARKKLDAARQEHEKRLTGLQQVQELHIRKAQTIEANTHRVEEASQAVNGLIGQGMDWVDIGKLIENEQKRDNVVAQTIKLPLKLKENTVTLLLDEPGIDDDSDDANDFTDEEEDSDIESKPSVASKQTTADKRLAIDIDLGLTPWANATQYYDQKKTAAQKEQKTVAASEKALKSMQKKTETDLKKGLKQEKDVLRPARKLFWFEKFLYFISSDGYLVLGGKDAQQNELLYRRYLKSGDIYVHADLQGASSVIVKNNPQTPDAPIPPSTLSQAGALSVCSSSAWDSKAVMAAWWVKANQVSKTAPTGEYLTTGGFIITGQKNFLPPSQLLLGFGVYWLISNESLANHGKHRLERTESMFTEEAETLAKEARGLDLGDNVDPNEHDDSDDADEDQEADEEEQAVPDVEEAADDGAEDIEQHQATTSQLEQDSDDESSDKDTARVNPLQFQNKTDPGAVVIEEEDEGSQFTEADNESEIDSQAPAPTETDTSKPPAKSSSKKAQPKRGANTKAAKRRAAKYAEQDEEDRELAMSLLGSTKADQRRAAEEEAKAAREAKSLADRERRRAQHQKAAEAEKARQQRLARQREKGEDAPIEDDEEENAEQAEAERREHMNISLLVPAPEPGDELVAAIPVVAPWNALSRCKYKVKLQPGSVKKGRAMREIVGVWTGLANRGPKVVDEKNREKEKVWVREVDLLKGWKVEEIVGILPAKGVRVVQSGGMVQVGGAPAGNAKGGKGASGKGRGSKKR